jgi:hypothetical protein
VKAHIVSICKDPNVLSDASNIDGGLVSVHDRALEQMSRYHVLGLRIIGAQIAEKTCKGFRGGWFVKLLCKDFSDSFIGEP